MGELRRLERYFEISLTLLVLVPFAAIFLGGGVSLPLASIFLVATFGSIVFHRRGLARPHHARLWNIVIVAWVAIAMANLFLTDTSILEASINVVLVLTLIKLFSRLSERDELQIYALTFLMLAAATTVNEDVTFGLLFGLYVTIGTFSLAVFHLRSELRQRPRLGLFGDVGLTGRYVGVLVGISGVILAASLTIFFAFPRVGLGFFQQQSRDGISMAGFSDSVELGGHGTIRDNPEVVMRVEFPNGRWEDYESIHWRTITFDTYEDGAWKQTRRRRPTPARPVGRAKFDLSEFFPSAGHRDVLQIYLEPIGTNLLPVVSPPERVKIGTEAFTIPWSPRSGDIGVTRNGDVTHTIRSEMGIAYVLHVGLAPTAVERLDPPHPVYLELPPLTSRVRQLARDVAGDGSNDERAASIERHLQTAYAYSLEQSAVGTDPIDAFLFETKSGHCEYFASSAVLMLRAVGIPARLVNGFLGGRWNDAGDYLAVRQGDAHSWAEYWSPQRGWVEIDPTPPAGLNLSTTASLAEVAREYWDALRMGWMKWVIEYDLSAQIEFFRRAARAFEPRGLTGERDAGDEEDERAPGTLGAGVRHALVFGGLALIAVLSNRHIRRRVTRRLSSFGSAIFIVVWIVVGGAWLATFQGATALWFAAGSSAVGVGVFIAMLRRPRRATLGDLFDIVAREAARRGEPRAVDEPPVRYLRRLARAFPGSAADLQRFEEVYARARFGGRRVDPDQREALAELARRVQRSIARQETSD